jgi:hypothetical protein
VANGSGDRLPDEIVLTLSEAAEVLFALDDAMAAIPGHASEQDGLRRAAGLIVDKLTPDLRDL